MTWMFTYTGREFDFEDALSGLMPQICLEDIGRSLADKSRFGGHLRHRISVAEHSWVVAIRCGELAEKAGWDSARILKAERRGFSHDFQEAYGGDWLQPLKVLARRRGVTFLDDVEDAIAARIAEHFHIETDDEIDLLVKLVDEEALAFEKKHYAPKTNRVWGTHLPPAPKVMSVNSCSTGLAYGIFMGHAERLGFSR
jgi:hypothetical protein